MQVFDIAMMDVNLNGTDSYPVAEVLAARGVPFLFSTGYSDHAMKEGYRDRPVWFQPHELVDTFTHLLAH